MKYLKLFESFVNEAKIDSESKFRDYAMKLLKKSHPDDFDEKKAEDTIESILKKCDGDFGAAVGMITGGLGESSTYEGKFEEDLQKADVAISFKDNTGAEVEVKELYGEGMAGEPMTFPYIVKGDKVITIKDAKKILNASDFKELEDYLNGISDSNHSSAVSYTI